MIEDRANGIMTSRVDRPWRSKSWAILADQEGGEVEDVLDLSRRLDASMVLAAYSDPANTTPANP